MKYLVKTFYNVLINCENYKDKNFDTKKSFFCKYLELKSKEKTSNILHLIDYFDKYRAFCFDLSSDSVLRGELNFKYRQIYIMAVPKRKTSKARRNKRRSHHQLSAINVVEDKKSGEFRLSHHIDLKTGIYNGKQIIEPKK